MSGSDLLYCPCIVCLAGCLLIGGCLSGNRAFSFYLGLSGWLLVSRRLLVWKLLIDTMFIVRLAGYLLVGSCVSGDCFCTACLLSVWLAACSLEAACQEVPYVFSVYCLSHCLPAHQRPLVCKLLMHCLFSVCLAGCLLDRGFLSGSC